jgi:hypothetical protein
MAEFALDMRGGSADLQDALHGEPRLPLPCPAAPSARTALMSCPAGVRVGRWGRCRARSSACDLLTVPRPLLPRGRPPAGACHR